MYYISQPESINDLRPSFGLRTPKRRSKCHIQKYIDNTMKISNDSKWILRQDKRKSKDNILVG